jgi:hypothetical protein
MISYLQNITVGRLSLFQIPVVSFFFVQDPVVGYFKQGFKRFSFFNSSTKILGYYFKFVHESFHILHLPQLFFQINSLTRQFITYVLGKRH